MMIKGERIKIQLHDGSTVFATVVYLQGDNATVEADNGFVYEVEREEDWQGAHRVI